MVSSKVVLGGQAAGRVVQATELCDVCVGRDCPLTGAEFMSHFFKLGHEERHELDLHALKSVEPPVSQWTSRSALKGAPFKPHPVSALWMVTPPMPQASTGRTG